MKNILAVAVFCTLILNLNAQNGRRAVETYNFFGISAGLTQFTINTDDANVTTGSGWNAGLSTRGSLRRNLDMVYFLHLSESRFSIEANDVSNAFQPTEQVEYKLLAAKLGLLASYKIIGHNLSVEAGPILQLSDKLKYDERFENFAVTGAETVSIDDFARASNLNFHLAGGLTFGFKHFRVYGLYEYGLTNMLSKIDADSGNFKGNAQVLTLGATVYF